MMGLQASKWQISKSKQIKNPNTQKPETSAILNI
jgi:hypothetical protein